MVSFYHRNQRIMIVSHLLTIQFVTVILQCWCNYPVKSWTISPSSSSSSSSSSFFVPTKQKSVQTTKSSLLASLSSAASISMYFDDISRNSVKWTIPSSSSSSLPSPFVFGESLTVEQKQPEITKDEIMEQIGESIDEWARSTDGILYNPRFHSTSTAKTAASIEGDSDLVKKSSTTPMYHNVLGPTIVCESETVFGSISQFWNTVLPTILDTNYIDKFSLQRWIMVPDVTFVQFIVFPFVPIKSASDGSSSNTDTSYNDWVRFKSILEYSIKEHTSFISQDHFSFHLFHVNQTSSSTIENGTTSTPSSQLPPYPVIALQYKPACQQGQKQQDDIMDQIDRTPIATSDNGKDTKDTTPNVLKAFTRKDPMNDHDEDNEEIANEPIIKNIIDEPIIDLHAKRSSLQRLYNSEAGQATTGSQKDNIVDKESTSTTSASTSTSSTIVDGTIDEGSSSVLRKFVTKYQTNSIGSGKYEDNMKELYSSLSMVRTFDLEYRLRKRSFTDNEIQAISMGWVTEQATIEKNPLFYSSSLLKSSTPTTTGTGTSSSTTSTSSTSLRAAAATATTSDAGIESTTNLSTAAFWFGNFISKNNNPKTADSTQPQATVEKNDCDTKDAQSLQIDGGVSDMELFVSLESCGEGVFGDFWSSLNQIHERISASTIQPRKRRVSNQSSSSSSIQGGDENNGNTPTSSTATSLSNQNTGSSSDSASKTNKDDVYTNLYSWMNKIVKPVVVHESTLNSKSTEFDFDNDSSSSVDIRKLILHHEESESFRITGNYNTNSNNIIDNGWDTRYEADGSMLFVAANMYPYNAEAFKRFAITIFLTMRRSLQILNNNNNSILDNGTGKKNHKVNYYLEVFHPEYVASKKGYNHEYRRSPFPMIQVLYQIVQ